MSEESSIFTDSSVLKTEHEAVIRDKAIKEIHKAKSECEAARLNCSHIPEEQVYVTQQFYLKLSITLALTLRDLGELDIYDEYVRAFL